MANFSSCSSIVSFNNKFWSALLKILIGSECWLWIQLYFKPQEFGICSWYLVLVSLVLISSSLSIGFNVASKSKQILKGCLNLLPSFLNLMMSSRCLSCPFLLTPCSPSFLGSTTLHASFLKHASRWFFNASSVANDPSKHCQVGSRKSLSIFLYV